jgi:hypothetical protein
MANPAKQSSPSLEDTEPLPQNGTNLKLLLAEVDRALRLIEKDLRRQQSVQTEHQALIQGNAGTRNRAAWERLESSYNLQNELSIRDFDANGSSLEIIEKYIEQFTLRYSSHEPMDNDSIYWRIRATDIVMALPMTLKSSLVCGSTTGTTVATLRAHVRARMAGPRGDGSDAGRL